MASWPTIARRIRVPLGFGMAGVYLWLAHPSAASIAAGVLGIVPGLVIRGLASGHVRKNEALTTSGPYAYTRNPLYLGSLLLAAGFAVAARSWWIVAAFGLLFFAIYLPVIGNEEDFLRSRFPEYSEYASRVPRLLPRLTAAGRAEGGFEWDLYCKHREYNALIGAAVMLLALAGKLYWTGR